MMNGGHLDNPNVDLLKDLGSAWLSENAERVAWRMVDTLCGIEARFSVDLVYRNWLGGVDWGRYEALAHIDGRSHRVESIFFLVNASAANEFGEIRIGHGKERDTMNAAIYEHVFFAWEGWEAVEQADMWRILESADLLSSMVYGCPTEALPDPSDVFLGLVRWA